MRGIITAAMCLRAQQLVLVLAAVLVACGAWAVVRPASAASARPRPVSRTVASAMRPAVAQPRAKVIEQQVIAAKSDCAILACIALTFDDGPQPEQTPRVLDALRAEGVRATFFVTGKHVVGHAHLVRRMHHEGHEVGNHSWSHTDMTTLDSMQMLHEFSATQTAVMAAGVPAPTLFRPPYGATNPTVDALIPVAIALWNVDPEDWRPGSPEEITQRVISNASPGRVILLHDIDPPTADALPAIIQKLKVQNYTFVTFSELFDLAPTARGHFYGR